MTTSVENGSCDDGDIGKVVMKTYNVERENGLDNLESTLIDNESVGAKVEFIVEVAEGDKKSHNVVTEDVDDEQPVNEAEQPLETRDTDDLIEDKDEEALLENNVNYEGVDGIDVICEGVDGIDEGQGDNQLVVSPINITREENEFPSHSFLIKFLRFEDEKLDEQIVTAQLQLYAKTRRTKEIIVARDIKLKNMMLHKEAYNAKISELRDARQSVKLKGQQIDHVQRVMNKIKNVIALKDFDSRTCKAQHMLEHKKICSNYKNQSTREIEEQKSKRARLASETNNPYEIQHALAQKDQIEEHLKDLNMELETLKNNVLKVYAASDTKWKEYVKEHEMERELWAELLVAEESRQVADWHVHCLEKQLSDKVERFKDGWNSSEEFRKDYISKRNIFATQLSSVVLHDNEPIVPIGIVDVEENEKTDEIEINLKENNSFKEIVKENEDTVKAQRKTKMHAQKEVQREMDEPLRVLPDDTDEMIASEWEEIEFILQFVTLERQKRFVEEKHSDNQAKEHVPEESWKLMKNKEHVQKETENKLKETIGLEKKVKANEANEHSYLRKAQTEAKMQAKKESQQREKASLKRLRKKERKQATRDAAKNINVDIKSANGNQHQQHPAVAATIKNRKGWRYWGHVVTTLIILILYVLNPLVLTS